MNSADGVLAWVIARIGQVRLRNLTADDVRRLRAEIAELKLRGRE